MKQLKDAFTASIDRAEKTLNRKNSGSTHGTSKNQNYAVTKLSLARAKKREQKARDFAQMARNMGLDDETLAKIDAKTKEHAQSPEKWIFIMLSAAQNDEVIEWLQEHSKRPHKAQRVWSTVLRNLRIDTGEILQTRQELAARVGVTPQNLSQIMTELASINAIRREKDGRQVKYYLNPNIATHQGNAVARSAAREEAGPLLKLMDSGRDVVDDDSDVIDE